MNKNRTRKNSFLFHCRLTALFKKHQVTVWSLLIVLSMIPCASKARTRRQRRKHQNETTSKADTARSQALKLVKIGVRLLRGGYYVGALEKFKKAYELYPSPKIFFNIAQTQKELGRYVRAIQAYEKFLKKAPKDTSKDLLVLAKERIEDLRKAIAVLKIEISQPNAEVTVNGTLYGTSPLNDPIRLMPGTHTLVIKKKGYNTEAMDIKLKAGQTISRHVILERPKQKLVEKAIVYKTIDIPPKGLALLWTGMAVTAVAGITASVLGGLALREEKKMGDSSLSISERLEAADRGDLYAKLTDGFLISGGVLAIGTLCWYLFYVRPSGGTKRIRVNSKTQAPRPSFNSGTAGLSFSF